ncbi:hypothetical protein VKT23_006596 [Stygiomarasmius scandens]|uniref:Protein kinase domain-containing protein n=1 Tax=Marasmiellus scandens TaxID=2682957 RepID=A0ABR1JRK4_9AGAR
MHINSESYHAEGTTSQLQNVESPRQIHPNVQFTVQRVLEPLANPMADPREYAQTFFDILQIHKWLQVVDHPKILHRGINPTNIMFYRRDDDTVQAVLNDFDLSSDHLLRGCSSQRMGSLTCPSIGISKENMTTGMDSKLCSMIFCCHYEERGSKI